MTFLDPETYNASLPRVSLAAGGLITDGQGRILLVKPTYRDYWQLPGGVVEHGEAPHDACRRELSEEIGLDRKVGPLLLIDWAAPRDRRPGMVLLIFDAGVHDPDAELELDATELEAFTWVSLERALTMLSPRTARRLPSALDALADGRPRYLPS